MQGMVNKFIMRAQAIGIMIILTVGISVVLAYADNAAKDRLISFIPRDEYMDVKSWEGNTVLSPVDCKDELMEKFNQCQTCSLYETDCPSCCLKYGNPPNDKVILGLRCTKDDAEVYDCGPAPFSSSLFSCFLPNLAAKDSGCPHKWEENSLNKFITKYIPLSQREGCWLDPLEPDGGCNWDEENKEGYCKKNDYTPRNSCSLNPDSKLYKEQCKNLETAQDYYKPKYVKDQLPGVCPGNSSSCYFYKATDEFKNCAKKCKDYADNWEACIKLTQCCYENTCFTEEGGYQNNCGNACSDVMANPECQTQYNRGNCLGFFKDFRRFLIDDPSAATCFTPIDKGFFYRFLAKNNEKTLINWQVRCQNQSVDADGQPVAYPQYNFYTMVKVFEAEDYSLKGNKAVPVHTSIIHQKAFQHNFAVISSTFLTSESLEKGNVSNAGKAYVAVICYFIPKAQEDLKMQVSEMKLIIVRHRD
jgi:hypothetical protein